MKSWAKRSVQCGLSGLSELWSSAGSACQRRPCSCALNMKFLMTNTCSSPCKSRPLTKQRFNRSENSCPKGKTADKFRKKNRHSTYQRHPPQALLMPELDAQQWHHDLAGARSHNKNVHRLSTLATLLVSIGKAAAALQWLWLSMPHSLSWLLFCWALLGSSCSG